MLVVVAHWRRHIQPHAVQVEHIWMDGVRYQIWGWSDPGYGQIQGMVRSGVWWNPWIHGLAGLYHSTVVYYCTCMVGVL